MVSAHRAPWVLLSAVVGALVLLGAQAPAAAKNDDRPRDVVIIGAPGLAWSDITTETAPAIHEFAQDAAVSNLNVRSTYFTSCPGDGWLGLSAGQRAAMPRDVDPSELRSDPRALPTCDALTEVPAGTEPRAMDRDRWTRLGDEVAEQGFDARIGALGTAVARSGGCLTGHGPGVSLALVDEKGQAPDGEGGIHESCPVTLVGTPPVAVPGDGPSRAARVEAVDEVVADTLEEVHPDTVVLLAGLSDDGGAPGLRVLAMGGGGTPAGSLHSGSTTRDEMAQVADLTHTALATAGVEPPRDLVGRALVPVAGSGSFEERREALVADDAQLRTADAITPPFFRAYGIGLLGLLVLAGVTWKLRGRGGRLWSDRAVRTLALCALCLPAATYLVTFTGWYAADRPLLAFTGAVGLASVGLTALVLAATLGAGRLLAAGVARPAMVAVGLVSALTAGLLTVDLLLAGRMTMLGVLGLLPLDGGRFHGLGNVPFAIFAAASFLLIIAVVSPLLGAGRRRLASLVVGALGGATLVVGAWLGADGGGALALIPALLYLLLAVAGVRLTWPRAIAIAVITGVGFLTMAGLDWLRPEAERTHLGAFFQSILDGGAGQVLRRKLETNIDLLLGPERAALLVPVVLVVVIWVLARPQSAAGRGLEPLLTAHPGLRVGLTALVIALTVGFLLNDSGTAIPAAAALLLGPALVLLACSWCPNDPGKAE